MEKVGTENAAVVQNAANQDDNIELSDTAKAFLKKREAKETTNGLMLPSRAIVSIKSALIAQP